MDDILRDAFYEEADEMFQEIEDALLEIDGQGATRERIDNLDICILKGHPPL